MGSIWLCFHPVEGLLPLHPSIERSTVFFLRTDTTGGAGGRHGAEMDAILTIRQPLHWPKTLLIMIGQSTLTSDITSSALKSQADLSIYRQLGRRKMLQIF